MNKKVRKRRLFCWLLTAAMLLTGVPVQAAFGDSGEALFTSGMFSDGSEGSGISGGTDSANDPIAAPTVTPSAAPTVTPSITPEITPSITPSVTPSVTPTVTPSITPTVTPVWVPELGKEVQVKFADGAGTSFYDNLEIATTVGSTITLPNVPGREGAGGNIWKLEQDKEITQTFTFEGEQDVALSVNEDLVKYIKDGVLTLYAVQKYSVSFYNNSGSGMFKNSTVENYEGTVIKLPDFAYSTYVNYGWTTVKGSETAEFKIGDSYTITKNQKLYIIRYLSKEVKFLNPGGSSNSAMAKLTQTVIKGKTIKLPAVPTVTGYSNLGWSLQKNASKASYAAGRTVTVNRDLTFYAVRKKFPYTVSFDNNKGTSTSKAYAALKMNVAKDTTITLPEVPKAAGYTNVGWTTEKGKTTPVYKAGSKIKITKSTVFYAVRKKSVYYTVTYCLGSGSTNTAYKNLKMKVEEGTTITLPSVPARTGYVNLGWSGTKNPTSASKRTTYTVRKNVTFYAVQKTAVSVVLHYNNGTEYKTVVMSKGDYFKLPCVANKTGYTFMGWSTSPYMTVNPTYEAEENIKVNKTINLYAVVFNRASEPDLSAANIPAVDLKKYKKVIFVGDSRTVYMRHTMANLGSAAIRNAEFVCESGQGLNWLQSSGYSQLLQKLGTTTNAAEKPTAVIFNLGVNDLGNLASYMFYMNGIAPELENRGCRLFYESLNPINSKLLSHYRDEAVLRNFNSTIRSSLSTHYTYIDTYSYLMKTGYGTDNGYGTDDGLHYTGKTYKRIYKYCITKINEA